MLINGAPGNSISIHDRGLLYGDGVFRTLLVIHGRSQHWPLHYQKIEQDCAALGITCPDGEVLSAELAGLSDAHPDAVFKLIVTRGITERGYSPLSRTSATHLWDVSPLPVYPDTQQGVTLRLCRVRLGHQPRLAGIKHLNRLENVLAAAECADVAEGLLLDSDGLVIEGVRSNVFLIFHGVLITPDLSRCGVAGVQRERVVRHARQQGMQVEVRDVELDELRAADELFLTNSVFGLWSVAQFEERRWTDFSFAVRIRAALAGEVD